MFLCNKKSITFLLVHVILFLSWLLTVTADIRFTFHLQSVLFYTMVHLVHMRNQAEDLTGISPFIIIKTDQFEKMTVYLDSFPCIKKGCAFPNAPSVTFYAITLTFRTPSIISRPFTTSSATSLSTSIIVYA